MASGPSGYAITSSLRKGLRYFFTERLLTGFGGGLNLRDAATELKPNESPNCWNVTLDERGGVAKRLGYQKWNASAVTNLIQDSYFSTLTGFLYWYSPTDGKLYSDPGTGVLTLRHTFTTGYSLSLVDFAGSVIAAHGKDGLYSSTNGTTFTAVTATSGSAPTGFVVAVWQNKLWVVESDSATGTNLNKNTIAFSAAGDFTKWASADGGGTIDIREKDDAPVIALIGGPGNDLQSQPGLFVFKTDSTYRIYDSTTGAYMTVDPIVGAASKKSVVALFGELFILSRRGLYATKKLATLVPIAEQLYPLFDPSQLADRTLPNWCAGYKGDRVYFSMATAASGAGTGVNDLAIEYAPLYGWAVVGSNAMGCYQPLTASGSALASLSSNVDEETLLGASPSVAGQVYELGKTGADDGTAIQSWFESRWFEVSNGHQARLNLMRTACRGAFTMTVWTDFASVEDSVAASTQSVSTTSGLVEDYVESRPFRIGRAFKLRVDETSTLTFTNKQLFPKVAGTDSGSGFVAGAWALYSTDCQFAPLGLS